MKLTFVILYHKNPIQLFRLVNHLTGPSCSVVIHVCKNESEENFNKIKTYFSNYDNVRFSKRSRGRWGGFSLVKASLDAMQLAVDEFQFDYLYLISGQDYPVISSSEMMSFLKDHRGKEFINYWPMNPAYLSEDYFNVVKQRHIKDHSRQQDRYNLYYFWWKGQKKAFPGHFNQHISSKKEWLIEFVKRGVHAVVPQRSFMSGLAPYAGSQWFTLSFDCVNYCLQVANRRLDYVKYMQKVSVPDEMFFQSIILNGDFQSKVINHNLRAIFFSDQEGPQPHPEILDESYLPKILNSKAHFSRKFDMDFDEKILNLLDEHNSKTQQL
ncbi:beta-1,6-N-acetylglucosaminyltransferase [Persicobacter psychrovividus]|uniref:Peptide O-xylosyltransferase n=1 Tax=Persicobacter psychrovividus TaxID=387638 RepID=A0ABM7VKY9_9BACT|nr:glycosyl transferase [Persicobacter psychrovividus]